MKIKLIADSTCDLSPELIEKYDVAITPLTVTLGDKSGKDGLDMTPEDIYSYVSQTGQLPKTSAVNIPDYADEFRRWKEEGYSIIQICLGSGFSSTYKNACLAAEGFDDIYVIDSHNLSTGQGILVVRAGEMIREGKSAQEIYEACCALTPKVETSFVINRLDYLYKGGRCSALAMLGANILNLKPCIEVKDGLMGVGKKFRGKIGKVMVDYVEDMIKDRDDIDKTCIFITHTACDPADVEAVRQKIKELHPDFKAIYETVAGCTITTHCGPSTLGILYVRK